MANIICFQITLEVKGNQCGRQWEAPPKGLNLPHPSGWPLTQACIRWCGLGLSEQSGQQVLIKALRSTLYYGFCFMFHDRMKLQVPRLPRALFCHKAVILKVGDT